MTVTQDMVGHKLGEFAITRKRFTYKCVRISPPHGVPSDTVVLVRQTDEEQVDTIIYSALLCCIHLLHLAVAIISPLLLSFPCTPACLCAPQTTMIAQTRAVQRVTSVHDVWDAHEVRIRPM